ncbi:ras GTPase-activating protein raskol-like [Thrips palmi]|uniref:Ras GTPase-activating protein raskol-like n=1 Tax=Thrips palmi TaxID=161013 RepID=A0A6P8ZSW3_THRPL|nr:ras GTPase-activating protein raskol-like [Thrips palmi]
MATAAALSRESRKNKLLLEYPCRVEGWLNVCECQLQTGPRPARAVREGGVGAWEPHFCVLLQDEQTLTAYRSEELAVLPWTPVGRREKFVGRLSVCLNSKFL